MDPLQDIQQSTHWTPWTPPPPEEWWRQEWAAGWWGHTHQEAPKGWVCPACEIGVAPWKASCPNCVANKQQAQQQSHEPEGTDTLKREEPRREWMTR